MTDPDELSATTSIRLGAHETAAGCEKMPEPMPSVGRVVQADQLFRQTPVDQLRCVAGPPG